MPWKAPQDWADRTEQVGDGRPLSWAQEFTIGMVWWDEVDGPREVEQKARRLVNVLAQQPGDRERKLVWLMQTIPLMEAELEREGLDAEREPKRFAGGMKSLACRWWRQELKKPPPRQFERVFEKSEPERLMNDIEKAQIKKQIEEQRRKLRGGA